MKNIQTKNYILALIYLILITAIVILGIIPYFNKLSQNQNEYLKTKNELDSTLEKYMHLVELSKKEREILDIKADVFELLPDDPQTADFVVKLESLAKELNIPDYISSVSTSQEIYSGTATQKTKTADKKQKNKVAYSIGFNSNYLTIKSFIEKISDFPRFTTISSANISGYNPDTDTMNFKLNGTLYYGK